MRSGALRNGRSDPHRHRSGVNASSSASTYGQESCQGYLVAEHFTRPEIFTKYLPLAARSSSRRKPAVAAPCRDGATAMIDQHPHTGRFQHRGHLDQLIGLDLHVGEHVQLGESRSSVPVSRKASTPSNAACIVVPTIPRSRSFTRSSRLTLLSTTATPLKRPLSRSRKSSRQRLSVS